MIDTWNGIVETGTAFSQEDSLTIQTGKDFFASQSYTGVAEDEQGRITGQYILHPNDPGRWGHICNASFAVSTICRGQHIGEKLVTDCMKKPAMRDSVSFSSMQWWKATSMHVICISGWGLSSLARSREVSERKMAAMKTSARITAFWTMKLNRNDKPSSDDFFCSVAPQQMKRLRNL